MNYQELENTSLNKDIYLLSGDEYLISSTKSIIAKKLQISQINIAEFNDENFDANIVINACNQFSFFNQKRIVCVSGISKELKTDQKTMFLNYSEAPNNDTILLLENNSGHFDFIKNAQKIECIASESFVCNLIKTKFNQNGKEIDVFAAKKLALFCLNSVERINTEIKKICDYLGEDNCVVTEKIIQELVTKDTELKVFDLTTALSSKNKQKSQEILYDMLQAGEQPIKILGLISNHFRRMFFAKINKGSNSELANLLSCKEFAITKAKSQAENFSAKQLKDIQNLILQVDYSIKSGQMTQENALYYLIFKIVC